MTVIIAGGGIGGLTAALSLARFGIHSVVLEQAAVLGEIGAGIQLGPNAFHAFDRLGMGDEVRRGAVFVDAFRLMNADNGREIANVSLGEPFRTRFGNPYAVVHRADLHASILERCRASAFVRLETSRRVTGYSQTPTGVTVRCADGSSLEGDVLVGADGLRSAIRAQLVADGEPRVSGHTTFRSVIPVEDMPEDLRWSAVTIWVGAKCHLVHYPLKDWKVFNLVVTHHNDVDQPVSGQPVAAGHVQAVFSHVDPVARRVIERGSDWRMWVLCDRDPVERWIEGRVALLGDAAHPALQYLAQGACMAIEDALCLSECLAAGDDVLAALLRYRDARLVRTARVQIGSRMVGDHIFHPPGVQARMRDEVLGGMGDDAFYDAMAWLYDRPLAA